MSDVSDISVTGKRAPKVRSERYHVGKQVNYYRARKEAGQPWIPRPSSKLHAFCISHGLDPEKVVLGEQSIDDIPAN